MKRLRQALRKVLSSRWFPTVTRPLVAGGVAALLTYLLGVFHVVGMGGQIHGIATALAGLLVTAIVQKPGSKTPSLPPSAVLDIEQIAEKLAEKLLAAQATRAYGSAQVPLGGELNTPEEALMAQFGPTKLPPGFHEVGATD